MTEEEKATETTEPQPEEAVDESSVPPSIPLHAKWTMWFDNPRLAPPGSDWKENLKECGSFDTVEGFWRIFNNLKPATYIGLNSNYSCFRHGVQPAWEDPENVNGGKFVLTLKKTPRGADKDKTPIAKLDELWLFTVLALLGETLDATGDQVNGAVVSLRKSQDRIALWIKSSDQDICVKIGERWKKALEVKTIIRYQTHKDAAQSGRSFRNEIQFEV